MRNGCAAINAAEFMNAGFSNLATLKAQLLSPSLLSSTDWDARVLAIGLGVAGAFEVFCNRKFKYTAGALDVTQGDRSCWYVQRYRVTQFTKVELRFFRADAWTDISGQPLAADEGKGLIHFGYTLGREPMQVRVTYNGGYWWPQLDSGDAGYPDTVPADITNNAAGIAATDFLLPAELQLAWFIQCRQLWAGMDKIGDEIAKVSENPGTQFVPQVERILTKYIRRQLT